MRPSAACGVGSLTERRFCFVPRNDTAGISDAVLSFLRLRGHPVTTTGSFSTNIPPGIS